MQSGPKSKTSHRVSDDTATLFGRDSSNNDDSRSQSGLETDTTLLIPKEGTAVSPSSQRNFHCNSASQKTGKGFDFSVFLASALLKYHKWFFFGWIILALVCAFGIPYYLLHMQLVFLAPKSEPSYWAHQQMKKYFPLVEGFSTAMIYVETPDGQALDLSEDSAVNSFFFEVNNSVKEKYGDYILGWDNYWTLRYSETKTQLVALGFINVSENGEKTTATYSTLTVDKPSGNVDALLFFIDLRSRVKKAAQEHIPDHFTTILGLDSMFIEILLSTGVDVLVMIALALPIAFAIIGLYLKSAKLMIFPIEVVVIVALVSFGLSAFMCMGMYVIPFVPGIQAAIFLAMSIDYTLFISTQYKKDLMHGYTLALTIRETIKGAGKVIIISGSCLLITLLSLCFFSMDLLTTFGLGCAISLAIIILSAPTMEIATILMFPNFFTTFSFNKTTQTRYASQADMKMFKLDGKFVSKMEAKLQKKQIFKIDELSQKELNPLEISHQNSSSQEHSNDRTLGKNEAQGRQPLIPKKDEEPEDLSSGVNQSQFDDQNPQVCYCRCCSKALCRCPLWIITRKRRYEESFAFGNRPALDRTPTPEEQVIIQEKSTVQRYSGKITKLVPAIIIVLVFVLTLIPSFFMLNESHINYNNLQTVPSNSDVSIGIEKFGNHFSPGLIYPFTVLLSPKDDTDKTATVFSSKAFYLQNMIIEMICKQTPENLQEDMMIAGETFMGGLDGGLPTTYESAKERLEKAPEELNYIESSWYYEYNMMVSPDQRAAQIMLTPRIPWSGEGSEEFNNMMREILNENTIVELANELGLRLDLFCLYSDVVDSSHAIYSAFPIIILIVSLLLLVLTGIAYKSIFAPCRILLSLIINLAFTYGICSIVFNISMGEEGFFWVIPAFTFPIVIGLGTDYDSFLFSTIRLYRTRGLTTRDAVRRGMYENTITIICAGLIMTASFIGLVFSAEDIMKQLGFVLVIAVLADTIAVMSIFVPAITYLGGKAVWWPWTKHMKAENLSSLHVFDEKALLIEEIAHDNFEDVEDEQMRLTDTHTFLDPDISTQITDLHDGGEGFDVRQEMDESQD